MIYDSWVGACPVTPLPFEDYPSSQALQTGSRNKENQTREPLAMIQTQIVGSLM